MSRRTIISLLLIPVCAISPATAQYFGQNKITYEKFNWKTYESPHFDIYYYEAEEKFLEEIISFAESAYLKLSTGRMGHHPLLNLGILLTILGVQLFSIGLVGEMIQRLRAEVRRSRMHEDELD